MQKSEVHRISDRAYVLNLSNMGRDLEKDLEEGKVNGVYGVEDCRSISSVILKLRGGLKSGSVVLVCVYWSSSYGILYPLSVSL